MCQYSRGSSCLSGSITSKQSLDISSMRANSLLATTCSSEMAVLREDRREARREAFLSSSPPLSGSSARAAAPSSRFPSPPWGAVGWEPADRATSRSGRPAADGRTTLRPSPSSPPCRSRELRPLLPRPASPRLRGSRSAGSPPPEQHRAPDALRRMGGQRRTLGLPSPWVGPCARPPDPVASIPRVWIRSVGE